MLELYNEVDSLVPDFNPQIAEGLIVSKNKDIEKYVKRLFEQAAKDFPPELKFVDFKPCTPVEIYRQITERSKNKQGKSTYEFSESNIFMRKAIFELHGKRLDPVYIYLPYVKPAGIITIKGSNYSISPVLADMSLSVGQKDIFIYMNKSRITWNQFLHHYVLDGVQTAQHIVWARAHNSGIKPTALSRKTSNIHYLFCKYGLTKSFQKYANANVVVGYDEINYQNYPENEYHIASSIRTKPPGKNGKYTPSNIRMAIPKRQMSHMTQAMIVAFFYLVDHFPDRVTPEVIDNISLWRILLGHCIFKSNDTEGKLLMSINAHLVSVDSFVDKMVGEWLESDGVLVEDAYDLFAHVADTFDQRISISSKTLASLYNKRLLVLRYVLYDLTDGIFNTMFDAVKLTRNGQPLKENDIYKVFRKRLKPKLVTMINRKHAEVSSVSSSSDNIATKLTANVVMQSNMAGTSSSKAKGSTFDDSKALHASIAEVCSFNNLPKSDITGRGRLSMYVRIRHDDSIERNPKLRNLLDNIQQIISRD